MQQQKWKYSSITNYWNTSGKFIYLSPHSPSPFLNSLQTFRSSMDAPSLTVARVRKKYDRFAVYRQI